MVLGLITRTQLRRLLWLGIFMSGGAVSAGAAVFSVPFDNGEVRRITVSETQISGTLYVPMADLVRELSGEWQAEEQQVQVKLFGASALLSVDSRRVFLETQQYDLVSPIVRRENQVYIALSDVPPFFLRCFRIPLELEAAPESLPPPESGEEALLERMEGVPAPPPAPAAEAGGPLRVDIVVIDAGHGGSDAGANMPGGATEKDITLAVALLTAQYLKEQTPFRVLLTRDGDVNLSEEERGLIAREHPGSLFISIHCGTSPSNKHHGVAVYYSGSEPVLNARKPAFSQGLRTSADRIRESAHVAQALGEAVAQGCGAPLQRVNAAPLRVLNYLESPAALIEIGYLTNPVEADQLASAEYQQRIAQALVAGLRNVAAAGGPAQ